MSSRNRRNNGDSGAIRVLPPDTPRPHPVRQPGDEPPPRRSALWLITLGAAVGLVAVVLLGGDGDSTTTSEPPPTAAPDATTPAALDPADTPGAADRTAPAVAGAITWRPALVDSVGGILDMAAGKSRIVAFSKDEPGVQVLSTTSGRTWQIADDRQLGSGTFFSAIEHRGNLLAMTLAEGRFTAWTSNNGLAWQSVGTIEERILPAGVALASDGSTALMVATASDGVLRFWTSPDGVGWQSVDIAPGLGVWRDQVTAAAHNGVFYVAGSRCAEESCRPAVIRSTDLTEWEAMSGDPAELVGAIDVRQGAVQRLIPTDSGIVAVGQVFEEGAVSMPVVWLTVGADRLTETPTPGPLAPLPIDVTISAIASETQAVDLVVDLVEYTVSSGDTLQTANGNVEIGTVTDRSVELIAPDGVYVLEAGDEMSVRPLLIVVDAAASGQHVVAVGLAKFGTEATAATWTSVDGGVSWEMALLPGGVGAVAGHVAMRGRSIAILGTGDDLGTRAWSGEWRTERDEFVAERAARSFVEAVFSNDVDTVVAMLERNASQAVTRLPTLAALDIGRRWWSGTGGALDRNAVAETLAHLAGTQASATVGDCRASVVVETAEAEVTCDYVAASRLHAALGLDEFAGTLRMTVRNDSVAAFGTTDEPLAALWDLLARWTAEAHPQLLDSVAGPVDGPTGPVLDGDSAPVHLALAEEMAATWLSPGSSTVIDSPVGPMEWTWLEQPLGPDLSIGEVIATDDGFVATSYSSLGSSQPGLWTSRDGVTWDELPAPQADWLFGLHAFDDGLIVTGESLGVPRVWVRSGAGEWSAVTQPDGDDAPQPPGGSGIQILGVLGESALVRSLTWDHQGRVEGQRFWAVHADLTTEELTMPTAITRLDDGFVDFRAVAGGDSMALMVLRADEPPSLWRTPDLRTWEAVGTIPELDNVAISMLAGDDDRYLVMALHERPECSAGPAGQVCTSPAELWESTGDGALRPIAEFGYSAYPGAAHGQLGFVVVDTQPGPALFGPDIRPLRMRYSPDGNDWIELPRPMPFDPEANWLWVSSITVGAEHVLVGIESDRSRQDGSDFRQLGTLLVGTLIDR